MTVISSSLRLRSSLTSPTFQPARSRAFRFIDAEDIAAVAAETLASPDAHAGAAYALTGSEAITVSEAAKVIADVTGKPVKRNDIDRDVWIQGSVVAGVPAEYGEMLRMLTETIASGMGSRPNDNVEKVTGALGAADQVR